MSDVSHLIDTSAAVRLLSSDAYDEGWGQALDNGRVPVLDRHQAAITQTDQEEWVLERARARLLKHFGASIRVTSSGDNGRRIALQGQPELSAPALTWPVRGSRATAQR